MFSKLVKIILVMVAIFGLSTNLYASCDTVAGKIFIGTVTDPNSNTFLSRDVWEFNRDSTLIVIDSDQQGKPGLSPPYGFYPFSIGLGNWRLDGDKLKIKYVDFNYPRFLVCGPGPTLPCSSDQANQNLFVVTGTFHKVNHKKYFGTVSIDQFDLHANPDKDSPIANFSVADIELIQLSKP